MSASDRRPNPVRSQRLVRFGKVVLPPEQQRVFDGLPSRERIKVRGIAHRIKWQIGYMAMHWSLLRDYVADIDIADQRPTNLNTFALSFALYVWLRS